MVWAPDRAVKSRMLRPLEPNAETRELKLEDGPGRLLLAALKLAVRASLRPKRTVHLGPPSCIMNKLIVRIRKAYNFFFFFSTNQFAFFSFSLKKKLYLSSN